MANTNVTHKMIAREAAMMLEEKLPFFMNVNMGRNDEFGQVGGYKKGDYVDIKIPATGQVYDGAVYAGGGTPDDNVEQSVRLQLNVQKHNTIRFGAKEKLLEMTEFKDRYLKNKVNQLASVIEAYCFKQATIACPNVVGTVGTVPNTMLTYAQARARLQNYLAPDEDRSYFITSEANYTLVDASKALFHSKEEIERNYLKGTMGKAENAIWYEHQSCPILTNGTQASFTVNGANQTGTSLAIGGLTAANTITKGTVFTLPNVFRVHPLTGDPLGSATTDLQQFTVTADFTAAGTTGTISIFPAIQPTFPNKTVSASPANGATATLVGAASAAIRYNLHIQKDAFCVATAPLPVLASTEGYTYTTKGNFSVRVMTFGDGKNDLEDTRIDVLLGTAAVRPLHMCRIAQ